MTETANPPTRRIAEKRLQAVVGHLAGVLVACGLLMWSVFNFWLNVLAYRVEQEPNQAWGLASVLVFITCVIPFLIGMRLLFKTLNQKRPAAKS